MNDEKIPKPTEIVSYWKSLSDYDITTAAYMFKTKRYPYCLYMCQLSVEKILKALVVKKTDKHAPYTHNLVFLAKMLDIGFDDVQRNLLAELTEFNIEARYPEWKKKFYKTATRKYSYGYLQQTQKIQKWLKKFLKK